VKSSTPTFSSRDTESKVVSGDTSISMVIWSAENTNDPGSLARRFSTVDSSAGRFGIDKSSTRIMDGLSSRSSLAHGVETVNNKKLI